MDTLLIQVTNQKARGLIHELEELQLIKILEETLNSGLPDSNNGSNKPSKESISLLKDESLEIKENDLVTASFNFGNIPKGTTGTVVHKYANGEVYEVEFIINAASFVETVLKNQLIKK